MTSNNIKPDSGVSADMAVALAVLAVIVALASLLDALAVAPPKMACISSPAISNSSNPIRCPSPR